MKLEQLPLNVQGFITSSHIELMERDFIPVTLDLAALKAYGVSGGRVRVYATLYVDAYAVLKTIDHYLVFRSKEDRDGELSYLTIRTDIVNSCIEHTRVINNLKELFT